MIVYDVYTDLDPEQLTEVAKETYRMWLSFALGRSSPVGRKLINPTGRYAASLSWQRDGEAKVSIIADESVAKEAAYIETGTDGTGMRTMLMKNAKIAQDGTRYRVIPMRPDVTTNRTLGFNFNSIVSNKGGGEKLPARVYKMWSKAREVVDPKSRFRTMTDRGRPGWQIHPMPMYAPAAILSAMLREQYGRRS